MSERNKQEGGTSLFALCCIFYHVRNMKETSSMATFITFVGSYY